MSNVIQFPNSRVETYRTDVPPQKSYSVHIYWTSDKTFDFVLDAGPSDEIDEDRVASDLASLALSLRPPPLTLFERLRILFTGA